jgi:uncharacterized protein (DUF433 family)
MSKTVVMTLRLPTNVARGVERLANRFGHKPAQLGARLVEEGLRRRDFPQIDLRETAGGRVAYLAGTRFAVYWIAQAIRKGPRPEQFARQYELPVAHVRAALAYAAAFPDEINADIEHAKANQQWIESQDASHRVPESTEARQRSTRKRAA